MADDVPTREMRPCAICGTLFPVNPRYSVKQKAKVRYCSHRCSGKATAPTRTPMSELLGGATRFGSLTFLREAEGTATMRRGLFRCDCGAEKAMGLHHIRNGATVSCGCEGARRASSRFTKHGAYRTATYRSWNSMMQRCHNPGVAHYRAYGGRGIVVCPEWHGPEGFPRFLAYMGPRPAGATIDRIDNDRGYEPGNVRWASRKVQQNNRRVSVLLSYDGLTMNPQDWSLHLGMSKNTVAMRLAKGWSVERALATPAAMSGGRAGKMKGLAAPERRNDAAP